MEAQCRRRSRPRCSRAGFETRSRENSQQKTAFCGFLFLEVDTFCLADTCICLRVKIMDIWDAAILGVVEGLTEFLPVSSTGHLILAGHILGLDSTDFLKSFDIVIQLGAILAVVAMYGRTLLRSIEIWKRIMVAFIPTAVIGFLLYAVVKKYLLGNEAAVLAALAAGGVAIILFEWWHREHPEAHADAATIPLKTAAWIGVFHAADLVPGISRSAASILGGLALGLKRATIVEFSFLLAIPTMVAATGLDLVKSAASFSRGDWPILAVGFLVSFAVAFAAIRWFVRFVSHHTFVSFGLYRLAAALLFWFFVFR